MFFLLSKLLFYLIMPITWILAFFIYGLWSKHSKKSRISLYLSLGLLLLFSNTYLLNEAWLLWEKEPVPLKRLPQYDAGILLSGFTSQEKSPHDRVYTNKGADRMLHTLLLYRTGHIRKIIVSGGVGSLRKAHASEAHDIRKLLLLAGVPATDILLENKSKNTYENAQFTSKLINQRPELKSFILITSAFHMRRATACFKKASVPHDIFPADFYAHDRGFRLESFIPSEAPLSEWHQFFHEVGGFIVYKVVGYC